MANISNYKFDSASRGGYDDCFLMSQNVQNEASVNYQTPNFLYSSQSMKEPIDFATNQPNVFYNGGHEGSYAVDVSSFLKNGGIQTNPKCRISLFQRPFASVPYLGKGPQNIDLESSLLNGSYTNEKKSKSTISDKNTLSYNYTPLNSCISSNIQNPSNLIEEVADEGWVRGGIPTKDMTRQSDYVKRQNV